MKKLVNFVFINFVINLSQVFPQVTLPKLVSDGMVLQRNAKVSILGWSSPKEKIQIQFLDTDYRTEANESGEWLVTLSNLDAGGPYDMKIVASNTIIIRNILVGDVWVCSGQSQIDINMQRVRPLYEEEIKNADNSNIRYFSVPTVYNFKEPQKDLPSGKWEAISPKNILSVSAIAYFFATELYERYKVPIGIIRSSVGGSPAEAWISEEAIKRFPQLYQEAQKFKDDALIQKIQTEDRKRINAWYNKLNTTDKGYKNPDLPWYKPEADITDWHVMKVPGYWADVDLGEINGAVWFRKDIEIPGVMAGKPAKLNLGRIVDADSVFINGVFVGSVGYQYPPRRYEIPEGLLKKGKTQSLSD